MIASVKVVCAPDSYKECLSATAAAAAMADGVRRALPDAEVDVCPVADGGEGTVEALVSALGGEYRESPVTGPCGEPVVARWGLVDRDTAIIEMAAAAGLQLVPRTRRDPRRTTTFGVGELMLAAARAGARRLIVGLGGSATVDGGCGMAQALGWRFREGDGDGNGPGRLLEAPLTGGDLLSARHIGAGGAEAVLAGAEVIGACDVDAPLLGAAGAATVFGPQKGADPADVAELEQGVAHLSRLVRRELGADMATLRYGGAAGGLGAGLAVFARARLESGIERVLETCRFGERLQGADLCLTGEGRIDGQTLAGKACLGVARAAAARGVPTVALVGAAGPDADAVLSAGLTEWRLIGPGLTPRESMRHASTLLAAAAGEAALERAGAR
ncbi:glycerate kinase family protein [Lentisalinibacter sediminis]|uniref:glycerate kinase family protein n=1 Tax=Lentisalinibacter sediminis TaxID=2992237 RepID=UPI00386B9024